MPKNNHANRLDISDIIEAFTEIDKEITIVKTAIEMHSEKINQFADALERSHGNISKLKYSKPFNMWCMQDPNTHKEIDNYFDVLIDYLKALRHYGYTAIDANKLVEKIQKLIEIIKHEYFYFKETRRLLQRQNDNGLQSNASQFDQQITQLGAILAIADPILGDLCECSGEIDEMMRHFINLSAQDETYITKLLQKIKLHPELKEWCKPWAINWDDPEEEPNPIKTALAALPPLLVEVISYEQENHRTTFTIS